MDASERRKLEADLSAYLDGELEPQRAAEIERWLKASPEARRLHDELAGVSTSLAQLPRHAAPADLAERVREAAESRGAAAYHASPRPRSWIIVSRILASAAVLALCGAVWWEASRRPTLAPHTGAPSAEPKAERSDDARKPVENEQPSQRFARREILKQEAAAPPPAGQSKEQGRFAKTTAAPAPDALHAPPAIAAGPTPAAGKSLDAVSAPPQFDVTVAPRSAAEYAACVQLVDAYQSAQTLRFAAAGRTTLDDNATESRQALGYAGADEDAEQPVSLGLTHEAVVDVPAGRVGALLHGLEAVAPRQVQVAANFQPQQMAEIQAALAGGSVGGDAGGAGTRAEEKPAAELETLAREAQLADEPVVAAAPDASPKDSIRRDQAKESGSRTQPAARPARSAAKKRTAGEADAGPPWARRQAEARQKEHADAGGGAPAGGRQQSVFAPATTQANMPNPAAPPGSAPAGGFAESTREMSDESSAGNEMLTRLGRWFDRLTDIVASGVESAARDAVDQARGASPVVLRVRILPPPADEPGEAAASRPVSDQP